MASISLPSPPLLPLRLSLRSSSSALTLVPFPSLLAPIASTLRSEGVVKVKSHGSPDPALLRKPLASLPPPPQPPPPPTTTMTTAAAEGREISEDGAADEVAVERRGARGGRRRRGRAGEEEGKLVDWEDLILQDTVPLVGFVRMILHSGKYESGDRFSPEHEKIIIERLLPYHPEYEKKIGCGIDYITIGFHPEFENSRCLFIVRKDGELIDFSYWKCIKGLIRKNYPLYADSFILRHFRRRRDC